MPCYIILFVFIVQEIRELDGSQAELDDIGSLVRSRIAQLREQIEELKRLAQVSVHICEVVCPPLEIFV